MEKEILVSNEESLRLDIVDLNKVALMLNIDLDELRERLSELRI
ncbi:hypothetical protein [Paenibacillus sp. Soil750]|nr:hypothetical protein [Paenibacillus sp. Soil750]